MAVPPTLPKAVLRAELKERRQAFVSAIDIGELSKNTAALAVPAVPPGSIVAGYHAIGSEIDPAPLLGLLFERGHTIALPHVTGANGAMRFLVWRPGSRLEAGPFGLHQPPADAPEVQADVIFAPLLGFDGALNRIGYGAGHYDRAFARLPGARRIGLAWSVQACERIPVDPWDIPLHAVITETSWIER